MESADVVLTILNFLAIVSTAVWSVVGLRVEYKDDEGNVTTWGRRALIGAIGSGLLAAAILGVNTYRDSRAKAAASEQSKKNQKRIEDDQRKIDRLLHPFTGLRSLSVIFDVPGTDPRVAPFVRRVTGAGTTAPRFLHGDALPDYLDDAERDLALWFGELNLMVHIYRRGTQINNTNYHRLLAKPDLDLHAQHALDGLVSPQNAPLLLPTCQTGETPCAFATWNSASHVIEGDGRNIRPLIRKNSGAFTSRVDFAGATILAALAHNDPTNIPFRVRSLTLTTQDNQQLRVVGFRPLPSVAGAFGNYHIAVVPDPAGWQ